jgi:Ni/Co efflux regulator RcnB
MRTLLTILVAGVVATMAAGPEPAAAQDSSARERRDSSQRSSASSQRQDGREQTERTTRTFRGGQELLLSNIAGDINITRGGNEITVEIIETARGRDDADAKEMLQLVEVEIVERNNRVEVRTRYPQGDEMRRNNRRNVNVWVTYNVTAPAGSRVRATSISGSVMARDIRGEVSAESVSGTVRIINGGRVASAKSISGNVEVVESEIDGSLHASTASGSVMLRKVKARMVEAGSISGDVVLEDVDAAQVEGQTVSGSVKFGGTLARGGRYELTSHSGSVSVALAGNAGFEVEATSFSGSIRSDFSFGTPDNSERGRGRRSLRGVVGDGSSVVELTTFSGSIVIAKR